MRSNHKAFASAAYLSLLVFSGLIFAGSLLLASSSNADELRVLKYDKQGNVIGSENKANGYTGNNIGGKTGVTGTAGTRASKKSTGVKKTKFSKGFEGGFSSFNPDTEFEQGEVVVVDPPRGFGDAVRSSGFHVIERVMMKNLGIEVIRLSTPRGMSVKEAISIISKKYPGVTVDANTRFDPSAGQTESNARIMGGWGDLPADCGKGLVIGMIDSGIDMNHPALKGQNIEYQEFYKPDRQPAPPDHGTGVAAILVGKAEYGGLIPGAKLYAANMFEINEEGKKVGSAIGLIKSMDWLASKKVDAVNMSVAGGDNKVVRKALEIANRQKLLLIAAVGNWGRSDKPAYPAAYKEVVAVTAIKGGELIYIHANTGKYVDFAAPGVGIWVAMPGGGGKIQSGTSYATPYITAIAAVLRKSGRAKNSADFKKLLVKVTKDLGAPGKDNIFGTGAVRAKPSCK